jgi:hypothetical protein
MADPLAKDPFQFPQRSGPPGLGAFTPDQPKSDAQVISLTTLDDGGVEINVSDNPTEEQTGNDEFDANLADENWLSGDLTRIASDLIEGIEADDRSRSEWVDNYNLGLDLLGLRISGKQTIVGAETMSSVTDPILLEAILSYRSMALGEMLPADGPVKVTNDGEATPERDQLADDLQSDMNHYLKVTASEYYPDTDRGLIYAAFGGDIFKKVYYCPLRKRPVSECVYLPDLIVSQDATDLQNAIRITHRIEMSDAQVRRLMAAGAYSQIILTGAPAQNPDAIARKEKELVGVQPSPQRQEDYQRTIYECYTSLLLDDPEAKDAPEDVPLPYRVTIDKDSRQVLEIRRNWKEGDEDFNKRKRFVKWPFVPGFGFYDLGYLHILGQDAKATTALLRIMIDAGMFGSFPGGVKLRGARTDTNQIRPAPGEWVEVDGGAGVTSIRDVLMPLPYKDVSVVLLQLYQLIGDRARAKAGTVNMESGEGRTNIPVGTIMSMVEQQMQMMTAVHKGMHRGQAEELMLLRELFSEDPESLWKYNPKASRQWTKEELTDMSFVPMSDPNVPAHIFRVMLTQAILMLAGQAPQYFNGFEVIKWALGNLRIQYPEKLLVDPASSSQGSSDGSASGALPPEVLALYQGQIQTEQAKVEATKQKNQADAAIKAAKVQSDHQAKMQKMQADQQAKIGSLQAQFDKSMQDMQNAAADRESKEKIAVLNAQIQLLLKGIETLNQPQGSPDPLRDDKVGPGGVPASANPVPPVHPQDGSSHPVAVATQAHPPAGLGAAGVSPDGGPGGGQGVA